VKRAFLLTLALATLAAAPPQPRPPVYAWLAFGPKQTVRVLVCLEGKAVTLEPRAADKPVGPKKRFDRLGDCKNVTFPDPDGKTSYVIKSIDELGLVTRLGKALGVSVEVRGPLAYHQACIIQMAARPERARVAHFQAPLTIVPTEKMSADLFGALIWKRPTGLVASKGAKPLDLAVTIRNQNTQRGCYVVLCTTDETGRNCLFPKGARPVADVEFPAARPGGPPIRKRYVLDQFC
jgi:hypothetical protein